MRQSSTLKDQEIDENEVTTLQARLAEVENLLADAQAQLQQKAKIEEQAELISHTHRKLKKSYEELSTLFNISQALTSSIDPEQLANKLVDVILENVRLSSLSLYMVGDLPEKLTVRVERSVEGLGQQFNRSYDVKEWMARKVLKQGETVYIPDLSKEMAFSKASPASEPMSYLCVPMTVKDSVLGVCCFSRKEASGFAPHDVQMLTIVVRQAAIALENARLYAKTKELSLVDELTKIYNRRHFQKILEMEFKRARRFRRQLSLLLMDVDHFKKFNDSYGHLEGDRILAELANLFCRNLREVDTVARYGGEEFAVILPSASLVDAEKVALKLGRLVENMESNAPKARNLRVTISIGVSNLQEDDTLEDFVNHADIALYHAKAEGRNCVTAFSPSYQQPLLKVAE